MFTVPEQVTAVYKENLDTILELAGITATAAERLMDLNVKATKAVIADATKGAKAMADSKDVSTLASIQGEWAQPAMEKMTSYAKSTYGIFTETQAELTKVFEAKVAEVNKTMTTALDQAAKNAPAGSDVAVSAMKSAVAAANQAYDAFSKASRQVQEVTEATVAAAVNTPTKKKAA